MMGRVASFQPLRWVLVLLLILLCVMMGSAAALEQRSDFGHSAVAAKTPLLRQQYVDDVASLSNLALASRAAGADAAATARLLHAERNALKLQYRELTPPDLLKTKPSEIRQHPRAIN
jgi:ABC-type transport system involved in cytochrome bd biosynthesis fused ATPase/permease subunit